MLQCISDAFTGATAAMSRKGFTIDDTTLHYCAGKVPELWPNSEAPVTSMRMFRAWSQGWQKNFRDQGWHDFVQVVKQNGIKVLVAAPITCNTTADEEDWEWTKTLMKLLGREHIMGFAVGNELERLSGLEILACVEDIWDRGRLWQQFRKHVREIDEMGFQDVPVTSAFTAEIVYKEEQPFENRPGVALVNDFLSNATREYGTRFVFTLNIYPYFDPSLKLDPGHRISCRAAMRKALCWKPGCLGVETMIRARQRIFQLTRSNSSLLWIGEIGWSSPMAENLGTEMRQCPEFSSPQALLSFYEGFLRWNMSIGGEWRGPDHAFYFTLRDAMNFARQEHFGLMTTCENVTCKLVSGNWTNWNVVNPVGTMWLGHALTLILCLVCVMTCCTAVCVRRNSHRQRMLAE